MGWIYLSISVLQRLHRWGLEKVKYFYVTLYDGCYNWPLLVLTHWGRVTHICVNELNIIGSDNGLSPARRQAIIWTNTGIFIVRPLGTNFSEILFEIHIISFKKIHLKMSSGKWWPFCLNVLKLIHVSNIVARDFRRLAHVMKYAHGPGLYLRFGADTFHLYISCFTGNGQYKLSECLRASERIPTCQWLGVRLQLLRC